MNSKSLRSTGTTGAWLPLPSFSMQPSSMTRCDRPTNKNPSTAPGTVSLLPMKARISFCAAMFGTGSRDSCVSDRGQEVHATMLSHDLITRIESNDAQASVAIPASSIVLWRIIIIATTATTTIVTIITVACLTSSCRPPALYFGALT